MNAPSMHDAVVLLNAARQSGSLLEALPAHCRPATIADAHAIQDLTVAALGEAVAGWKIAAAPDGTLMRGVVLASRVLASPARMPAALVPLLGVEAEIAFRFERDLPPRDRDYSADEVASAVVALPVIEVVDSRFRSYKDTPLLHRLADCMSNGALVLGAPQRGWRAHDLATLHVRLEIGGATIVSRVGGHPTVDPLLPAIAMANHQRTREGVRAGQVMTTGSFTGLNYARPGQSAIATFEGFGAAQVSFED